jgi:glycosyltransferase involved in cell wall biosynthesis
MRPETTPERAPDAPLRVLVPYIATYPGGVRTVLRAGLPHLAAIPGIQLVYAELCNNAEDMDDMERGGVQVEREAGVPGPVALSRRPGLLRAADLAAQAPRLLQMAQRLAPRLHEYDVVYVHGHRELLLAAAARRLAGGRNGPALVWHFHAAPLSTNAGARGSWAGRRLVRLCSRSCARAIAISDFGKRQAVSMGAEAGRVVTVLNAATIDARPASSAASAPLLPERPEGAFVWLLPCASIRRHKGVHVAVEALRHAGPRHVLWVSGDASDPAASDYVAELEAAAAEIGASDRVRFVGTRRDIHRVMAAADIVVVPSVWEEPFGLVAAEAQLVGAPVVASRRGALPEVVIDGRTGLIFDAEDPRTLAAAVERLAGDPQLRARLAESARREASARYSYERWAREVAEVLRAASAERN